VADIRTQLQKRFEPANRFANFGNVLVRLDVRGFRPHKQTLVEIRSPITAFCGPNGTGKTTLLQLAACAFQDAHSSGYVLRQFFAVGPLDPAPFSATAQLGVAAWQYDAKARGYTLSRRKSRWSDYRARETRPVLFLGAAQFLPHVEQQGFAFRNAARLTVSGQTPCAADVTAAVAKILGTHYDAIDRAKVELKHRSDSILSSARGTLRYSEHHMGFGECRVHNLVETLEAQPEKSLVLLEEPEISLHQAAQYRFGEYLMSLASRRGHQVLLSTHSEHLLRALPQASRLLLVRDGQGEIQTLPGLASAQAASVMTDGQDKAITVVVEDDVARCVIAEIIAARKPHLLASARIVVGGYRDDSGRTVAGGKEAIAAAMKTMRGSGLCVAAVLDADGTEDPAAFVFRLPGAKPPEQEIFSSSAVQAFWRDTYPLDVAGFLAELAGVDHHDWFTRLAHRVGRTRDFLVGEAARIYAQSLGSAPDPLVEQLGEAASRK
jgi:predicted ATPase